MIGTRGVTSKCYLRPHSQTCQVAFIAIDLLHLLHYDEFCYRIVTQVKNLSYVVRQICKILQFFVPLAPM